MIDPVGPFPYDLEPGDNILRWDNYLQKYKIPTVDNILVGEEHQGILIPILSIVCALLLLPVGYVTWNRHYKLLPIKKHLFSMTLLVVGVIVLSPFFHFSFGNSARASQITEDDSKEIIRNVLKNVYRSFDFRDEEDVYDKLAISVSGELLTDIYLQNRKSFLVEQAGGAQAKVDTIEILNTKTSASTFHKGSVDIRAQWTATGTVGHWGHIHTRQNSYDAVITITPVNGVWKITGLELYDEKRLDPYASNLNNTPVTMTR